MTKTIGNFSALLLGSAETRDRHREILEAAVQGLRARGFSVFEFERIADCVVVEARGRAEDGRELIFDATTGRLLSDQRVPLPPVSERGSRAA